MGIKDIFHKHRLKYVLRVSSIFQMNHAQPPDHIGILRYSPFYLFLAVHPNAPFLPSATSPATTALAPTSACPISRGSFGSIVVANPVIVSIYKKLLGISRSRSISTVIADTIAVCIHKIADTVSPVTDTVSICIDIVAALSTSGGKGGSCGNA